MVFLNALQESPEVALVLARVLVLFALERSVLDICATVLAPVLWLLHRISMIYHRESGWLVLTVDFQCSDMVGKRNDRGLNGAPSVDYEPPRHSQSNLQHDTEQAEDVGEIGLQAGEKTLEVVMSCGRTSGIRGVGDS